GALRTFRIDRIERVFKPSGSYQIPEDFSVLDHLFLSFDFGGGEPMRALFSFREGIPRAEVERITHRRGAIKRADDRSWLWSIEIRDPMAAARFALSHSSLGMKPLEPTVVVDMWRDSIERTVDSLGA
ncbi:MAG: WYL domain-containing protein, partial [Collinsella sp.]|nr:WYL domain-containing protein [Collinsella sp.]